MISSKFSEEFLPHIPLEFFRLDFGCQIVDYISITGPIFRVPSNCVHPSLRFFIGSRKPSVHVPAMDTDLRSATWFPPRFVVEVFYRGIGRQDLLRQPSLKAVRTDKDVADLADSDRGTAKGTANAKTKAKAKPTKR